MKKILVTYATMAGSTAEVAGGSGGGDCEERGAGGRAAAGCG
ncbi:MAG: hypothetical protein RRC07_09385 [Anaerolineae bacterium]|nr:hypothetical protein [Anaerolineae bacterium]